MSARVVPWKGGALPTEEEMRAEMEAEGFHVYSFSDDPGTVYETHDHGSDQMHWIVRGRFQMNVGGETHELGPGDRNYLTARTKHSATVISDEEVVYLIGVKE